MFKVGVNELNKFVNNAIKRITNKISKTLNDLNSTINTLSNDCQKNPFYLHEIKADDVLKMFKSLRIDCSTRYNNILVSLTKPVADIASPLVYIINNCIKAHTFPSLWEIATICPISKVKIPTETSDYRPISVYSILPKNLKEYCFTKK